MAFVFSGQYAANVEVKARAFYETLSEKDQRRYVAVEAQRMGFGGIEYLAGVFGCSVKTIERGMKELNELPNDPAAGRVRRPGGGRKKKSTVIRSSKKIRNRYWKNILRATRMTIVSGLQN